MFYLYLTYCLTTVVVVLVEQLVLEQGNRLAAYNFLLVLYLVLLNYILYFIHQVLK